MDGPVIAAVVDGRADLAAAERAVAALRALAGGADLPVVLLAPGPARPAWAEAEARLDVVLPPHAEPTLHLHHDSMVGLRRG